MCEPATLAAISLATTAVGTGVSAAGAAAQGKAAQQQAEYEATIAQQNADQAGLLAVDAENRGVEQELDFREQAAARDSRAERPQRR